MNWKTIFSVMSLLLLSEIVIATDGKIDRKALVSRHNIIQTKVDKLSPLSVGNGRFCYTTDITSMQTFPELYREGIPLSTMSEWGWHSFPNTRNYQLSDVFTYLDVYGKKVPYPVGPAVGYEYLRANPHQMGLALIGLCHGGGDSLSFGELSGMSQKLDVWTGVLNSQFYVSRSFVEISTFCHPERDGLVYRLQSSLFAEGKLGVRISFPFPSVAFGKEPAVWNKAEGHHTKILQNGYDEWLIEHQINDFVYYCRIRTSVRAKLESGRCHEYFLNPLSGDGDFILFVDFFQDKNRVSEQDDYATAVRKNQQAWETFWESGGAVDLSGSKDSRWKELERRIVLSQYLTAIQSRQQYPPQETGLTCNSWYGKFHLEMHWWHSVHFALWNRSVYLENTLGWYKDIQEVAKKYTIQQGYKGIRWPKMVGPNGIEAPSSVGPLLIWQQPHFIYYAELLYREKTSREVLERYADLVEATAEFMYDYAHWDTVRRCYVLGPPLISAREGNSSTFTRNMNPTFELVYWSWGLKRANDWRERMGRKRHVEWDNMAEQMAPCPIVNQMYVEAEAVLEKNGGHPTQLAAWGFLPASSAVDSTVMKNTLRYVLDRWDWNRDTWGWDFPLMAMTAVRLNKPEWALEALFKDLPKNTYLVNGHNYQREDLPLYLPGNGGLLTVIAMMCAGWEGCTVDNPGFPKNGQWCVKWEGLQPMF